MAASDTFFNAVINNSNIGVFGLEGNTEKPYFCRITATNSLAGIPTIYLVDSNPAQPTIYASLTASHINSLFSFLDRNSYGSKYRNVLNNDLWKAVYLVTHNYRMDAYDTRRNQPLNKYETVVACRKCFLVLPTRIITIDHQGPQSGGELMAFYRVFRGLGLTTGGPRDFGKNYRSVKSMASLVGGSSNTPAGVPRTAPLKTLNATGILYYSIMKYIGWFDFVKKRCMHHYLNLRPLCGPCNSSLSNRNIW
jgi:hypothetical protein